MKFDELDKILIPLLCGDIGDSISPYRDIATKLNVSENMIIEKIKYYKEEKLLRRFGAILFHQNAGFGGNGMSAWNIPDNKADQIGEIISKFNEVSHCYIRPKFDDFNYNLYAMIHGKTEDECIEIAKMISEKINVYDYEVLFSIKEFKKSSMIYSKF